MTSYETIVLNSCVFLGACSVVMEDNNSENRFQILDDFPFCGTSRLRIPTVNLLFCKNVLSRANTSP